MSRLSIITLEDVSAPRFVLLSIISIFLFIPVAGIYVVTEAYSPVVAILSIELCRFIFVYFSARWMNLISTPSLTFSIAYLIFSLILVLVPDYMDGRIAVSYINIIFMLSATLVGFCAGMIYLLLSLKGRSLIIGLPVAFIMMIALFATNPVLALIDASLLGELILKVCFLFVVLYLSVHFYLRVKVIAPIGPQTP